MQWRLVSEPKRYVHSIRMRCDVKASCARRVAQIVLQPAVAQLWVRRVTLESLAESDGCCKVHVRTPIPVVFAPDVEIKMRVRLVEVSATGVAFRLDPVDEPTPFDIRLVEGEIRVHAYAAGSTRLEVTASVSTTAYTPKWIAKRVIATSVGGIANELLELLFRRTPQVACVQYHMGRAQHAAVLGRLPEADGDFWCTELPDDSDSDTDDEAGSKGCFHCWFAGR
jgi:hypothetical protein